MHSHLVDVYTGGNSLRYIRLAEFGNRRACLERFLFTVKGQAAELSGVKRNAVVASLELVSELVLMPYFTASSTVSTDGFGL
jgi:hypothetical protein